jgi:hypothetical protein
MPQPERLQPRYFYSTFAYEMLLIRVLLVPLHKYICTLIHLFFHDHQKYVTYHCQLVFFLRYHAENLNCNTSEIEEK